MIDLIFYLLNLSILILIGIYVFRKYFINTIKTEIEKKEAYKEDLQNEYKELILTQNNLENSIESQNLKCKILRSKVDRWQDNFNQSYIKRQEEQEELINLYQDKIESQSYYHGLKSAQRQLKPYVVKNLEKELTSYFSAENNAYKFLDKIISDLEK